MAPSAASKSPLPREHGAWAMLLQPFLGALIVMHKFSWTIAPALASVVLVFLIREPLITLARQKWTWRTTHPETPQARRYVAIELALLAASGAALLLVWPWWILAILGASAATLIAIAVLVTIRNRQRAVWFQALSAAGLGSSALAACLAVSGSVPLWGWWFWALHAAHFLAAILVVHARLDARVAARKNIAAPSGRAAFWAQIAFAAAGLALIATRHAWYGSAAIFSAAVHLFDLRTLSTPQALAMPMKTVGVRAMSFSIAFTLLVVAGSLAGLIS